MLISSVLGIEIMCVYRFGSKVGIKMIERWVERLSIHMNSIFILAYGGVSFVLTEPVTFGDAVQDITMNR